MRRIVTGKVMDDAYTVKIGEPLPPGLDAFTVSELNAETIFELACLQRTTSPMKRFKFCAITRKSCETDTLFLTPTLSSQPSCRMGAWTKR